MGQPDRVGKGAAKLGILDVIQGYYAGVLLLELRRLGVLNELTSPQRAATLAQQHRLDQLLTQQVLGFLAHTSDVIVQNQGYFQLGLPNAELSFQLEKFVGAYGPVVSDVGRAIRKDCKGKDLVDRLSLARAFMETKNFANPFVPDLISASGIHCLLDLGCGPASLLIEMAKSDTEFRGIGIDSNQVMCRYARREVRDADLSRRIKIKCGNATNLKNQLSVSERNKVEGVHGRSFLNEFFASGDDLVIEMLQRLRSLFKNRTAWFVDYYGVLGDGIRLAPDAQLALLQDLAQVVSRQGVPPPNEPRWRKIYGKARCKLKRSHEFSGPKIRWFIHEVEL